MLACFHRRVNPESRTRNEYLFLKYSRLPCFAFTIFTGRVQLEGAEIARTRRKVQRSAKWHHEQNQKASASRLKITQSKLYSRPNRVYRPETERDVRSCAGDTFIVLNKMDNDEKIMLLCATISLKSIPYYAHCQGKELTLAS